MKTWIVDGKLDLEHLSLVDRSTPEPGPRQVLVRIRAASVNPHDLYVIQGLYGPVPLPLVPLADGAGEVAAVGPGVTRVRVGERVIGAFVQRWTAGRLSAEMKASILGSGGRDGVLAEYAVYDEEGIVRIPDALSFEAAATLPIAGVTAWNALFGGHVVRPGNRVLVQGTGGVAMFAIQLAHAAGAEVVVISSSDAKLAKAKQHGARYGINYTTTPEWDSKARQLFGGEGVDLVVDVAGGSLQRSVNVLRNGGQLSAIGLLGGKLAEVDIVSLLQTGIHIQGIATGNRDQLEDLVRALHVNGIEPVIDRRYAFVDAARALASLANGNSQVGKVVIHGLP